MKHLIETTDLSSLGNAKYDRLILDSTKNEIVYRGVNTNGHSYVDLGLPSGTLWAKYNVGATSETAYGDYFMWGSTTPNNDIPCDWEHAPFNNESRDYDEAYFNSVKDTVCPNGILAKGYDAASHIMGGDWRMPTKDEIQELINNTTNEWISDYDGTGVSGRKFTSKTDTSKYIFIPAAGYRYDGSVKSVGDNGNVWSSSLTAWHPSSAWFLSFYSNGCQKSDANRSIGRCVGGVL